MKAEAESRQETGIEGGFRFWGEEGGKGLFYLGFPLQKNAFSSMALSLKPDRTSTSSQQTSHIITNMNSVDLK